MDSKLKDGDRDVEQKKDSSHYNEIPMLKIIVSELVAGVNVKLFELESRSYTYSEAQEGMRFLLKAHNKLLENK